LNIGFLPSPVDPSQWRWPAPFAPRALHSLHRYYEAVRPCPAHRYFRPRGSEPLAPFPLASPIRFSRSVQEPGWASRRLHAGCRLGRLRASPRLIPEEGSPPGFDIV